MVPEGAAVTFVKRKNPQQTQKPAWQRVFVYRGVGKYIKLGIAIQMQALEKQRVLRSLWRLPCLAICIIRFFLFLSNKIFDICFNLALYISIKTLYN
jgi:hypothetical protein